MAWPGMRPYKVTFSAVAITAAQDLVEIAPASTKPCWLTKVVLAQYTDFGDAQDEILPLLFKLGATTSGSGGSSFTPLAMGADAASGAACEINNTTAASAGTIVTVHADAWNVRAGYIWAPDPDGYILIPASGRLVVNQAAPADSITVNGSFYFIEAG